MLRNGEKWRRDDATNPQPNVNEENCLKANEKIYNNNKWEKMKRKTGKFIWKYEKIFHKIKFQFNSSFSALVPCCRMAATKHPHSVFIFPFPHSTDTDFLFGIPVPMNTYEYPDSYIRVAIHSECTKNTFKWKISKLELNLSFLSLLSHTLATLCQGLPRAALPNSHPDSEPVNNSNSPLYSNFCCIQTNGKS